jgi:hypothetical protein
MAWASSISGEIMDEFKDRDSITSKIKKLLALATSNSNIEEAASAAAKAQELLLRYNISESQVDGYKEKEERVSERYSKKHRAGEQNESQWKLALSFAVGRNNLCTVIHHPSNKEISWIGKESNILVAEFLFETLCTDIETIADALWTNILMVRQLEEQYDKVLFTDPTLRYAHGKSWKKSFYFGAVDAISLRLSENLRNLKKSDTNINALVVVNDNAVTQYVGKVYPKLGHSNIRTGEIYSGAYNTGVEAGKRMQFKRGVGAGGASGPKLLKG